MTNCAQPRLRRVESFPVSQPGGEVVFALRDPEGFAGSVVLPYPAAVLASLMDGTRTLADLQEAFRRQFGQSVDLAELENLIRELDQRQLLDTEPFRARWKREIELYLNSPVRPPAHGAYAAEPQALREQLAGLFTAEQGPGIPSSLGQNGTAKKALRGLISPHIDLHRGGTTFAWAYKRLAEESDADLFVIFATAHNPLSNFFSVTHKHFDTPLGTVETDREFVSKLSAALTRTPGGGDLNLFADELAHRREHSIEFQAVFLQYLWGARRPFKIVPVLVGSFHEFIAQKVSPAASPPVSAFVTAMRQTAASYSGRICYVSSADLAHIGQRFGDREFLNAERLKDQAESDRRLLDAVCHCDSAAFFGQVAVEQDRSRICGLSPTYTMLEVARPGDGELLRYDQAVELDGTSCVSFASLAFY
jgi:MEMO1 family protein